MNKIIALTIGDAGGIGPEISVKVAISPEIKALCLPVIIGPAVVVKDALETFLPTVKAVPFHPGTAVEEIENAAECVYYCDFDSLNIAVPYDRGISSAAAGLAAYEGVKLAAEALCRGEFDALVTAPLSKESVNLANISFQGHTELVAEISGVDDFCMMQSDGPLRVVFATCHMPLNQVSDSLTYERVLKTIELLHEAALADGVCSPRLAVAGLNPHAGEGGYMGKEEIDLIIPAMEEARAKGIRVEGPFPSDTLFIESIRTQFDGIVTMYHDQGHIPFKMLAFDRGVNSTLGLPVIRTSVDHGTAFDIAWQGKADTGSLKAAMRTAVKRIEAKR